MSRTTRNYANYHLDCNKLTQFERTHVGLGREGWAIIDIRDPTLHGRDGGLGTYLVGTDGWREPFGCDAKRFLKKRTSRKRRLTYGKLINEQLE